MESADMPPALQARKNGALPDAAQERDAAEPRRGGGLMAGKRGLIMGVANDHSIAWGIAKALHGEGATLGFSSVESLLERRVRPLATSIGSTFVESCDVSSDEQLRGVLEKWKAAYGQLDVLVH